jgi:hypothetical protein
VHMVSVWNNDAYTHVCYVPGDMLVALLLHCWDAGWSRQHSL